MGGVMLRESTDMVARGRLDLQVVDPDGVNSASQEQVAPGASESGGKHGSASARTTGGGALLSEGMFFAGLNSGSEGMQWERMWEFDLELAWQQLVEFLWEWRLPLLLVATMACAAATAAVVPVLVPASAGTAAVWSSAPPTATAAVGFATVFSWLPGALAILQLAAGAGSVAVPVLTAAYAWHQRHVIAAAVFGL